MATKLDDITLTKQENTLTLSTKEKYVSDDVSFDISIVQGYVTQNAPTVNASGLVTATTSTSAGFVSTDATADSNTLQLPTKGAETYPFTTMASATIPAGKYLTGDQTILQAYTSGIEAGNIKYGEIVKVGDTANNGRIHNVAGTFTRANTVSSGYVAATSDKILAGYSAWVDGDEVLGTATGGASQTKSASPTEEEQIIEPDDGYLLSSVTVGAISPTYVGSGIERKTSANLNVSGKTVTAPAGYYASGASASVADGSVTPAINSHTVTAPSVDCKTNGTGANLGSTTKPSGTDGTDYWTFTPSATGTDGSSVANAKATVSAGYISSNPANSDNDTKAITTTINNGTTRYISKASTSTSNGSATVTAGTASTSVTGMVTTSTNTGYSVSASATGGNASLTASSVTVGAGYNSASVTASTTAKSATGENASQTKYIQKGVLSASVSSNSAGSASMAATGFTAASSATSYYVTLSTSPGSVKAKASVGTEGYVKTETNETSATNVSVSGNGNKLYIPAGTITNNTSGGTSSGTINGGSQIKVGAGYYPNDLYYTASQGTVPTGNIQLTQATSTDVTNYATATVRGVTGTIGGSASGGSATAAISNVNSMNTISDISGKTAGTDYWTVKATATGTNGTYTPKYTVSTSGWINSTVTGTAQDVSVSSDTTGKSIYIPKAVIAGSSTNATATTTVAPGAVSVSKQSVPSGVTNAASGDATTTVPSSGVYVAVKATTAANSTGTTSAISGSGSATVSTAGYAPTTLTGTVSVSGTATAKTSERSSSITYIPITNGSITNNTTLPSGVSSSGTVNRGSYIKISAGYHTADKYYLAQANSGTLTIDTSKNRGTISVNGYANVNVTGINIPTPTSGTNTFDVKVPNGSSTITFRFTVDTSGNVTVTNP